MNPPKIQVYCTVGEDELTDSAAGVMCTRCQKTLVNLDDPAAVAALKGAPSCGFMRRAAIPALAASSLALSGAQPLHAKGSADVKLPANGAAETRVEAAPAPAPDPCEGPIVRGKIAPPKQPEPPPPPPPEKPKNRPPEILLGDVALDPGPPKGVYPTAKRLQDKPGMVASPYTGRPVDITKFQPGELVCDPSYHMQDRKYFRVPAAEADQKQPK